MVRRALLLVVALSAASALAGDRKIPIRIEPPQTVKAIVIRSGDVAHSVEIRDGHVHVPENVALPFTVGSARFEPVAYTHAELDAGKPLLLRELGAIRGVLQRAAARNGERFTWLLQSKETVQETEVIVAADGAFQMPLPAGTYHGAVLGAASGSRIRSGIVVKPGQPTNLGTILCEPAVPVSVRVLDQKRGGAVAGARVTWHPPGEKLNAGLSAALYARRWSGVTDRQGIATIPAVGPLPLSVRWSVEAKGFAPATTAQIQLTEPVRFTMPDARLRPEATVLVRVIGASALRDATLALGERDDPRDPRFTRKARTDLRDGETKLSAGGYGQKRVWIENAEGKRIVYQDFEVTNEITVVDLVLQPVEIHGRLTRKGDPVEGEHVWLGDPHDAAAVLAKAKTDDDGEFRMTAWQQTPELILYTISPRTRSGRSVGHVKERVVTAGKSELRIDLEYPTSGFTLTVVEERTGKPLKATIDGNFFTGDSAVGNRGAETDDQGRYVVSDYDDGTAKLIVGAKGYRTRELEIAMRADNPEAVVKLEPAPPIVGRIVDAHGAPVRGARMTGGYANELDVDPPFYVWPDAQGRFRIDSPPPDPFTKYYIAAPGFALGVATLAADRENVIVLSPPSTGNVTLRPGNAMPAKIFMVMAARPGDEMIPIRVLDDLAEVNGMTPYQLMGTARDGSVVLPLFLSAGDYELFICRKGGKPWIYERVGSVTAPLNRHVALSYRAD